MLAMLAAKRRLRVAARGSGPGAKRRRPCPPLRAAAAGWRQDEGRPDPSTPSLRPGSNKGLTGKRAGQGRTASPLSPCRQEWAEKLQGRRTRAVQGDRRWVSSSRGLQEPPQAGKSAADAEIAAGPLAVGACNHRRSCSQTERIPTRLAGVPWPGLP